MRPTRPAAPPKSPPPSQASFRARYDALESQRAGLMSRLGGLSGSARAHPGYKRALTLLNVTFRKSRLPQRMAVLQAAAWLIGVLERTTTIL